MIDLDDVFVLYPCGDRQIAALRGLTLAVAPSERVVVTGPSGSGKSTLIRLVTGLVRPSAGSAVVLEHDLANASGRAILALQRTGIGVITQQTVNNLAKELRCVDNVAMQCRLTGQSRAEAVDQAEVMLSRLGVGHLARRSLDTLSAGEAQRVALAAALAHRPRVIVADEPTGALDLDNANIVFDLLAELSDDLQAALLVVSHDPGAGRIGHRVLEIRDGRLGSEHMAGADAPTLVVDKRGWVRLPERDRLRSGITERAAVDASTPTSSDLVLISPDGVPAPDEVSDRDDTETIAPFTPLLTLTDVSRTIGTTQVLAPTTISIGAGQLLIVSGRSGSGKTTLLGLIAGFTAPTSGTIDRTGRARVAVAAANPGFAETMTARENIALAWTVRGGHVDRHVRDTIDQHLADMGLIELADRAASTLSGGERQRLSVVRAIVSDAELVLLDEPTSQLDQGMARRMAAFLRAEASTGRAIVCASHEPELIAAADRVYALAGREPSPSTATKEPARR